MTFLPGSRWIRPRTTLSVMVIAFHLVVFSMAFALACAVRFDFRVPQWMWVDFWKSLPYVLAIKAVVVLASRQYRAWLGHISFADLPSLLLASSISFATIAICNHYRWLPGYIPRGVQLIDFAMSILLLAAMRSAWRMGRENVVQRFWSKKRRALLVGADSADKILAMQLQSHPDLQFQIVGCLDEFPLWEGRTIGGVEVRGTLDDLERVAAQLQADDIIAIAGGLPGRRLRELRRQCTILKKNFHVLPPLARLANGQQDLSLRSIEVDRLLRRPAVELDEDSLRKLHGATVAVTGAGGSIGSEVCRQLLQFQPARLILVERSEPSLYAIDLELKGLGVQTEIVPFLADVTDAPRLRQMFSRHAPQWLFHVAGHKHVPMLESHPGEAIKNNLFGTATLAEISEENGIERFVFISTDKAVNPSSVMGASKRLAENYVMAMSQESAGVYVAVRFGNVLGSVGSAVPLFESQIRRGGPITITHPDMERFFMTIAEAARLVLQASCVGRGGEIFVLDMGAPVKIVDLARDMVRMTGLPERAIDLEFVGLRPGEKLFEELYFNDEEQLATPHPALFSARHRPVSRAEMLRCLAEFEPLLHGEDARVIAKIAQWVPEFRSPAKTNIPVPPPHADFHTATVPSLAPSS